MKSYGGIEKRLATLANEFRRREFDVVLAMLRDSQVPYPHELEEGVVVRDLRTRSKRDGVAKIARFVRAEQPDVVITAKDHGAQAVLLSRILFRWKAPVFVTVDGVWSRVVKRPLQRRFVRWLYPRAEGIIAVSSSVRDDLCDAFGIPRERVRVIYNPVTLQTTGDRDDTSPPHTWLDEGSPLPVILGIGRLEVSKDFSTLLRAFARTTQDHPSRLIILGEGSQRPALEQLARELDIVESVGLPGQVSSVAPYLQRASLFVLSSRWEGFGMVIAEALAAGTPVVATDCPGGPAEILGNGEYGQLVPVGDVGALAEAMQRVLEVPPGREIRREVVERFDPSHVATAYLECMGMHDAGTRNR